MMSLMRMADKLQLKPGSTIAVLGIPDDVELELPERAQGIAEPASADAVIAFAIDSAALEAVLAPAISAARQERLAWIAYPKAGKLGTDLNRDILACLVQGRGAEPVRQVAIDDTWSAIRFRPRL
jgi:hypothetical protein